MTNDKEWLFDVNIDYEKGKLKGRTDVIDEIIEYYKPCNNCCACLEDDRDYFNKKCEMDMQISYTELVEYLEQLKEKTMNNENNPNLTEMIREIHDGVAREMYCKGIDDFATLMKAAINKDWATTKSFGPITYNRLIDKCNEIADELKETNK